MTDADARGSAAADASSALQRGDHEAVLRTTAEILADRPGDDAAHEYRARALLALGRTAEAESHAAHAVRLDPDEIRYRELLAEILAMGGAHRDAATEFGRLARNDPRQAEWTVAEARERLGAAQAGMSVDAARRAVRLDPTNARAQTALAHALARTGDARGALQAARRAVAAAREDLDAREALADALWLSGAAADAFEQMRALAAALTGSNRERVLTKARTLYRQHTSGAGRLVASFGPAFNLAFARGWLKAPSRR